MKKWQKAATGVLSLGMVGGMVVGCGSSSSSDTNSTSGGAVPKGQTITLWVWKADPWYTTVKNIALNWAKQHGDTVKVVNESQNPNGFQGYATAARTGKGPDLVFGIPHDNLGEFVQEGLIAKVPDNEMNLSDYPSVAQKAVEVNGASYAIPLTIETTEIAYNTKMIKSAPKTWNEFVKDANAHGFMYDQANLYDNYALISGFGGYVFKQNKDGTYDTNDIGLANAGSIKAFTLMHDMDAKYHWMTPSVDVNVATAKFEAGKIGMYVTGPWDTENLIKAKIPFAFAPWPTLSNGKSPKPYSTVETEIVNSRNASHEQAAWSLAKALANKTSEVKYFTEDQQLPALSAAYNSSAVKSDPNIKPFVDEIPNAVAMPNIPDMQPVWTAMSIIKNIISGKVDPKTGAEDFVNNIKKGIKVQDS